MNLWDTPVEVELQYQSYSSSGSAAVEVADHPVTKDLGGSIAIISYAIYCDMATDMEVLVTYSSYPAVLAKDVGNGHVVYIAYDFNYYNDQAARLISNAVRWIDDRPATAQIEIPYGPHPDDTEAAERTRKNIHAPTNRSERGNLLP